MIEHVKLLVKGPAGWLRAPATIAYVGGRIEFRDAAFILKDEIKSMAGAKWHGFDEPPRKIWSVSDCPRNRFQLAYLSGTNVYEHFEKPIEEHEFNRPLMSHQRDLANHFLTYHFGVMAAEMGTGKTLSLQEIMEQSGANPWWWIGPKQTLVNVSREFKRWQLSPDVNVELLSYDQLAKRMQNWTVDDVVPKGVVFDEASKLKNHVTQRSQAAQDISDLVRAKHGMDGYVILASGTPSPASPTDWWSLCEIAYPGFLKEGSEKALKKRMAIMVKRDFASGVFEQVAAWRDDEKRCDHCGDYADAPQHDQSVEWDDEVHHRFTPCVNEIEYLSKRLEGLVVVKHKKDVLSELPPKRYRTIECKPTPSILRAAQAIVGSAKNSITGFTLLRELSDGFQYREKVEGTCKCGVCNGGAEEVAEFVDPANPDRVFEHVDLLDQEYVASLQRRVIACPSCNGSGQMPRVIRETVELPCPKDAAMKDLLDENEEVGRIVVFAGFTGSVDRICNLCKAKKWAVVRCDGRGLTVFDANGQMLKDVAPLEYWSAMGKNARVAWVAHPESGGMGFTLVEARTCVFYSNSYKPEYRVQAEDRIHRPGMDENAGCTIVDLLHLPSDAKALETIRENRRLELLTMGELTQCYALAA